ncbi:SymE family type I addiction module toxin [Chitinophaga sp. RAB17]|uniref:SymE family type I addiction module toxin n=1 Tax=Chitinophaga sp. RAB17 TaxID=3233049 RepID=UPI003F8EA2A4
MYKKVSLRLVYYCIYKYIYVSISTNMECKNKTRHLTVKYIHQERTYDSKLVSCISLAGIWLQDAGFIVGDKVTVQVESNRIVISNLRQEKPVIQPEPQEGKAVMREIARRYSE